MREIDAAQIQKAAINLGEALIDAREWPRLLDGICRAVGATGVLLQGDVRTPDVPMTELLKDLLTVYFHDGWDGRDIRAARGVPLLRAGAPVVVDQDILTSEEMRRDFALQRSHSSAWVSVVCCPRVSGGFRHVGMLDSENDPGGSVRGSGQARHGVAFATPDGSRHVRNDRRARCSVGGNGHAAICSPSRGSGRPIRLRAWRERFRGDDVRR